MSDGKVPFGKIDDKALYRWLAIIAVVAVVAIALVVVVPKLTQAANQAATAARQTASAVAKEAAIPSEAEKWVGEFGARYADPVSTFYSELGYEAKYRGSLIMTDEGIGKYEIINGYHGETSPLGFTMKKLPIGDKIDQAYSVRIFNDWEAKNLSLYMNLIAKNPSPKGVAVVENQFLNYCAGNYLNTNNNTSNEAENVKARKILDTMSAVVAKYGSTAIYEVAAAKVAKFSHDVPTSTFFDSDIPTMVHDDNSGFSDNGISLLVNVDVYSGKTVTPKTEVIKDVQLACERQPFVPTGKWVYLSFGQD